MFKYYGFGLKIASVLAFPELMEYDFEFPDLTIGYGMAPTTIEGAHYEDEGCVLEWNDQEYLFNLKCICRYYVRSGQQITLDVTDNNLSSIRLYALGSVITAALLQRGSMPLHVSAILKNDRLILFTGDSGSGKSTTVAQLALKGYKIFTDDLCVLEQINNSDQELEIVAHASYPMVKLWRDSSLRLQHANFENDQFTIRKGIEKFGHFFHNNFDMSAYPIDKIFVLTKNHLPGDQPQKLSGMKAFQELNVAIYRKHQLHNVLLKTRYFKMMSQLIKDCPIYKFNVQSGYEDKSGYKEFPVEYL